MPSPSIRPTPGKTPPKAENLWLNLGLNILLPAFILMKGKAWFGTYLEPLPGDPTVILFLFALSFPVTYFAYDRYQRRKWNFFSIVGMISVFLTGGIGLLKLDPTWLAIKEAGIPALFATAVLISAFTPHPLFRWILRRPEIFQVERIEASIRDRKVEQPFARVLRVATLLIALSFAVSTVLNYFLATSIVRSPGGTDAFNDELGRLTLWSFPVIVLPSMIMMMGAILYITSRLRHFTGLSLEEIMVTPSEGASDGAAKDN